ncbi:DUF397 domain-containing protein [Streptomyces triculaminicus]|uniref:DUF397 domain-containing protein n=2 Tax=Streptomyces TaxID=1883 RepID=A0A939JT96_9ACTN|nr:MULTISPECIES: DUF397 domain-containing protein [Streptomyces]MBO0655484.1 DUF397 domain-containing protein [Streptomyces triculaminicus]QSY52313.1 DUF397 domain-containing protein [Streptomyces griseocarneus]
MNVVWHKSSYSASNSNCVEMGVFGASVAVRDSKDPHGPSLNISARAWSEFISGIGTGIFPVAK